MRVIKKIKAWGKQYDQWAQVRQMRLVLSDELHTCTNCGTDYQGRFCPQCGLKASIARLKVKNLFQNFLDIWGMGSRPMFRTIAQLFTRPGYMIADYLSGHQPLYFPPFKMLVVITVIYMLAGWLRGVPIDGFMGIDFFDETMGDNVTEHGRVLLDMLDTIVSWFNEHLAFAVIVGQTIDVVATRLAFRKAKVKWSLVELFFADIYMSARYYIIATLCILIFKTELDETPAWGLLSVIIILYHWLTLAQLYQLGVWKSLMGYVRKTLWQGLVIVILVALLSLIVLIA